MYKISFKGSLEKVGIEYGLQPEVFKGKIEHSVNNESNFAVLRHIWQPYLKIDVLCLAFKYAKWKNSFYMERQNMSGFSIKDCLAEASLGWKCFEKYNQKPEFYTFNDKYVRIFKLKSFQLGRVVGLNRYFESNQGEKILKTIKKHIKK